MNQYFKCQPHERVRANVIDCFFKAIDNDVRSCDFAKLVELDARGLQLDTLYRRIQEGFEFACDQYPKTRFRFESGFWHYCETKPQVGLTRCALNEPFIDLEPAFNAPLPKTGLAIQETLFYDSELGRYWLMLRFHHALGDAISAINFLTAQLAHAFEYSYVPQPDNTNRVALRSTPEHREHLARPRTFLRLQSDDFRQSSKAIVELPLNCGAMANLLNDLRYANHELRGIRLSESDLILSWAFRAVIRIYGSSALPPPVFAMTVRARAKAQKGFGNYSGMIRIAPTIDAEKPLANWLHHVNLIKRKQLQAGAGNINPPWWLARLPYPLLKALIDTLNRLGKTATTSAMYTYYRIPDSSPLYEPELRVKEIYSVASLNQNYPFILHMISFKGVTRLMLTYDRCETVTPKVELFITELRRLIRAECRHALVSDTLTEDAVEP